MDFRALSLKNERESESGDERIHAREWRNDQNEGLFNETNVFESVSFE
jgi:hypothetical protein